VRNYQDSMHPLDPQVHYGISDRNYLDIHDVQMELLPDKLHQLRWKLHQKAWRGFLSLGSFGELLPVGGGRIRAT
jgi:hypothetical protein